VNFFEGRFSDDFSAESGLAIIEEMMQKVDELIQQQLPHQLQKEQVQQQLLQVLAQRIKVQELQSQQPQQHTEGEKHSPAAALQAHEAAVSVAAGSAAAVTGIEEDKEVCFHEPRQSKDSAAAAEPLVASLEQQVARLQQEHNDRASMTQQQQQVEIEELRSHLEAARLQILSIEEERNTLVRDAAASNTPQPPPPYHHPENKTLQRTLACKHKDRLAQISASAPAPPVLSNCLSATVSAV
jgi:chorismate mutase